MNNLDINKSIKLIKEVGEEIVGLDELPSLYKNPEHLVCYDGFEPSGQMHIAQGLIRAINTNKMIKSGFKFKMYVADWFAYLNNKMGGDRNKIKIVGEYFKEIWNVSGMDLNNVEFVWASDLIKKDEYWELVMKVAKTTTLKRVLRTTQIMGRSESDDLASGMIFYPCMQTADIFVMGARVTQLGMDQRKVNMLAREVGEEIGYWKPVIVTHHMLRGLGKPIGDQVGSEEKSIATKMSKSIPDSAIFMTDTKEDIKRKIMKAYCPEGEIRDNPILEYCKYIIFESHHLIGFEGLLSEGFIIERPERFGGKLKYRNYKNLEEAYENKALFPLDLKNTVIEYLNKLLEPSREHFIKDLAARQLLEKVLSYQITR